MTKSERAEAVRRKKAKERRYRKAAVFDLTLFPIFKTGSDEDDRMGW